MPIAAKKKVKTEPVREPEKIESVGETTTRIDKPCLTEEEIFEKKIKDIRFLKELLDYLHTQKPTKKEFREKARETYKDLYDCVCLIFKCYYPSVMLDEE